MFMNINFFLIGIAILGVIVPITIYVYSKKNKRIKCLLSTYLSLIDINPHIKDDIKIYYKKEIINNISMIEVEIINNGNIPIKKEDLATPITFEFDKSVDIIYDVSDKVPSNINVDLSMNDKNTINCYFDLLNPKDTIKIRFTILGDKIDVPRIHGHIEDVSKLEIENLSYSVKVSFWKVSFLAYIIISLLCFIISVMAFQIEESHFVISSYVALGIGTAFGAYLIWQNRLRQKA